MIVLVDLKLIDDNPFQTRQSYPADAIQDLADNIASLRDARPDTLGLIHVPVARPVGHKGEALRSIDISECRFQVAAGHCRLRAFRSLAEQDHDAWWRMPLDVTDLDDQAMADIAWSENQKRRDLTPIERARALQTALARFSWTQIAIGERWGLSQSAVANAIRLLYLPEWAVEAIHQGEIAERHGRALLGLLPLAPPWPSKAILSFPDGRPRTAEDLENEVRLTVDQKTRSLDKAPWWEAFQGWAPTDHVPEARGSCAGCSCQITALRQQRCTNPACYSAKTAAYKREVAGPSRAKELHGNVQGWERVTVQPWTPCNAGCDLTGRDVPGNWYAAGALRICPHCWLRADLPEPPKEKPNLVMRPVTPPGGVPIMRPAEQTAPARPVSAQAGASPRPEPVMRPATPAPRPISLAPIAPAPEVKPVVLLNARIYPGPDLAARKVLLSVAEEGRPPAAMVATVYESMIDIIREKLDGYFAERTVAGEIRNDYPAAGPGEPEQTLYEDEPPAEDAGTETEEEE